MADEVIDHQSYISGPRWAFGVATIYDYALAYGLTVKYISEHKGWLAKTITYTVSGTRSSIGDMMYALAMAVNEANGHA